MRLDELTVGAGEVATGEEEPYHLGVGFPVSGVLDGGGKEVEEAPLCFGGGIPDDWAVTY